MKKVLSLVVVLCLMLSVSAFAYTVNETGMPIVDEKVEVTIMAYVPTGAVSYEEQLFPKVMEERSNVHVNWIEVSPLACDEKVNLALASNDLPDAFMKCSISNDLQQRYGEDGVFVALNDYLETYMPGFNAALNEYPDLRVSIEMPDGTIYGVPYTNGIPSMGGGPNGWYNKKFYDALGIEEPKTLDEFYNALLTIRDSDVNGNGEADEVPFLATIDDAMTYIGCAFGLRNHGSSSGYVDEDPENPGNVRFWPTDAKYLEALQFCRKLFAENLLVNEYDGQIATAISYYNADRVGFTLQLYTQLDQAGVDFDHITQPLSTQYGEGIALKSATSYGGGNFIITTKCECPEVLCRWVDYFYTDDGMELYFMGVENETFVVNEDGTLSYTEEILNNPDGLSYVEAFGKYLCWGDGRNPALLSYKYFQGGAETTPQQESLYLSLKDYIPEEIWPSFSKTDEESKFFAAEGVDIETCVKEFETAFVSGTVDDTEEAWNTYIEQLNSMGLEQYIQYKQAGYERYKG